MSDSENVWYLGADFKDLTTALEALKAAFASSGDGIKSFVSKIETLDEGKAVIKISAVTEGFQNLEVQLKDTDGKLRVVKETVKTSLKEMADSTIASTTTQEESLKGLIAIFEALGQAAEVASDRRQKAAERAAATEFRLYRQGLNSFRSGAAAGGGAKGFMLSGGPIDPQGSADRAVQDLQRANNAIKQGEEQLTAFMSAEEQKRVGLFRTEEEQRIRAIMDGQEQERRLRAGIYNAMRTDEESQRNKKRGGIGGAFDTLGERAAAYAAGGFIVQGANMAVGAAKQAIGDAIELDRRISRLTVSQTGAALTSSQLNNEVIKLAKNFNMPALDVAEARFKAVSLGAVKTGQAFDFLNASLGLAQVTGANAADATTAVAAAINSFGLKASDAGHISEVFFKSFRDTGLDMGHLGDVMGRLGSVASPLGIKFEEMNSILGTFTKRGITSSDAAATLTNWIQRLAAPTAEFAQKIHELGFSTAEEAIRSGHLAEVLGLLSREADLSSESVTKLMGGIRSSRGALSDVGFFEEAIDGAKELSKQTNELTDALTKVQQSPGEALSSFFNSAKLAAIDFFGTVIKGGSELPDVFREMFPEYAAQAAFERAEAARKKAEEEKQKAEQAFNESVQRFQGMGLSSDAAKKAAQAVASGGGLTGSGIATESIKFDPKEELRSRTQVMIDEALKQKSVFRANAEAQVAQEELITKDLKDQLEIRLHRYEESIQRQNETAAKSKEVRKASEARVDDEAILFAEGKFKRQQSLLTADQQAQELRAMIPGNANVQTPFLPGIGQVNFTARRLDSLRSDRDARFSALGSKTGEDFLASKDVERAQKDQTEIGKVLEDQFAQVAADYKSGKASLEQVMLVERQISDEKEHQVELEKKLQEAMTAKENRAKAAADAEKVRFDKIKNATEEALKLTYDEKKFPNKQAMLARFDQLRATGLAGVSNVGELAGLEQLLQTKRNILEAGFDRAEKAKGLDKETKEIFGLRDDLLSKADLADNMEKYSDEVKKAVEHLEQSLVSIATGKPIPSSGGTVTSSASGATSFSGGGSYGGGGGASFGVASAPGQFNPKQALMDDIARNGGDVNSSYWQSYFKWQGKSHFHEAGGGTIDLGGGGNRVRTRVDAILSGNKPIYHTSGREQLEDEEFNNKWANYDPVDGPQGYDPSRKTFSHSATPRYFLPIEGNKGTVNQSNVTVNVGDAHPAKYDENAVKHAIRRLVRRGEVILTNTEQPGDRVPGDGQ